MAHQAGHTLPRTNPDGALPPVRPRLPGQGGAMSFMDTVADLVRRHRYLHDPARPEWQTAADVLAWAGDDLPDEVTDRLALSGLSTIGRPEFPGHRLSDGLADWVTAGFAGAIPGVLEVMATLGPARAPGPGARRVRTGHAHR